MVLLQNKFKVTPTRIPNEYAFNQPEGHLTRDDAINLAAWLILTTGSANEVIELITAIRNAGK